MEDHITNYATIFNGHFCCVPTSKDPVKEPGLHITNKNYTYKTVGLRKQRKSESKAEPVSIIQLCVCVCYWT